MYSYCKHYENCKIDVHITIISNHWDIDSKKALSSNKSFNRWKLNLNNIKNKHLYSLLELLLKWVLTNRQIIWSFWCLHRYREFSWATGTVVHYSLNQLLKIVTFLRVRQAFPTNIPLSPRSIVPIRLEDHSKNLWKIRRDISNKNRESWLRWGRKLPDGKMNRFGAFPR